MERINKALKKAEPQRIEINPNNYQKSLSDYYKNYSEYQNKKDNYSHDLLRLKNEINNISSKISTQTIKTKPDYKYIQHLEERRDRLTEQYNKLYEEEPKPPEKPKPEYIYKEKTVKYRDKDKKNLIDPLLIHDGKPLNTNLKIIGIY